MARETTPTIRPAVQGARTRTAPGDPSPAGHATRETGRAEDGASGNRGGVRWLGQARGGSQVPILGFAHGPRLLECLRR